MTLEQTYGNFETILKQNSSTNLICTGLNSFSSRIRLTQTAKIY